MKERTANFGRWASTAMTLVISACAVSVHTRAEPAVEQHSEARVGPAAGSTQPEEGQKPADSAQPEPGPTSVTAAYDASHESEAPVKDLPAQAVPRHEEMQVPVPVEGAMATASPDAGPSKQPSELWRFDRGEGNVPLVIPRNERLVYEVHLNLGWFGNPTVGKVTMTSEVKPYYSDVAGQPAGEQALISGRAEGSYKVYTLDNTISSVLMPQAWPRTIFRNVQSGSENRACELMIGTIDGKSLSRYRHDTHCKGCKNKAHFVPGKWPWQSPEHCDKCKRAEHRVWVDPKTRDVPEGSFDMVTAVFLARSLVIDGRPRIEFPLVDTDELWQVQLTRGRTKRIETTAGKFNTVEVELKTGPPEGTAVGKTTQFEGLFGIHGTISIWMEASSGVPIRIEGAVPAGPIDLDVTIDLCGARGTPHAFAPLPE